MLAVGATVKKSMQLLLSYQCYLRNGNTWPILDNVPTPRQRNEYRQWRMLLITSCHLLPERPSTLIGGVNRCKLMFSADVQCLLPLLKQIMCALQVQLLI